MRITASLANYQHMGLCPARNEDNSVISTLESMQRYLFIRCVLPKTKESNLFQIPFVINIQLLLCLYLVMCFQMK